MRILITGGAGFIGSNLALYLQDRFKDYEIYILDDFSCGVEENLKRFKGEILSGSVTDINLIESLKKYNFDFIFHMAAITDTTLNDEDKVIEVNIGGFKNILRLMNKKTKLIYASSAAVYGNEEIPMYETMNLSPLNVYAVSKAECDKLASKLFSDDFVIIGLRYFNVYGPGERHKKKSASMIFQLYQQIKCGKNPTVFKYGEHRRDFIYIKDAVQATVKTMELPKSYIINVATGKSTSFNEIIEKINKALKTNLTPHYIDNPYSFYQNHTLADITLMRTLLNFTPQYSIDDGINEYINILEKCDKNLYN